MTFHDYRPSGRVPFAVRLASIAPTDVVLDVGCGLGNLERHLLAGKCAKFYGVDADQEHIRFAQSLGPADSFLVAKGEALPFPDAMFDKVLCLDTLEHVESEERTLAEIRRVLKPGGSLVLSVPNDFLNFLDPDELTRGLRNIVRKYVKHRPPLDHPKHRHYGEQKLRHLLAGGFEVEHVHKSGTPIFWFTTMFHTGIGIPEKLTVPLRRLTDPLDDFDYALALPTGFNIMLKATKRRAD